MAFDGSGVYSLLYNWATEAASPPIAISKLDTEMAGIATGLSSCMLKTGGTVTGTTTFSGATTFTGSFSLTSTLVRLLWNETDAATDEKIWEWRASGGAFSLIADNDSSTGVTTPMAVTRTGTTIDSITFAGTTIAITGNETVSGTLAVTGAATLSSTLALTGNLAINTNKFNVTAASGNTTIAGTLGVTGAVTGASFAGSHTGAVAATTLSASSATTLSSTLAVTGNTTFTGDVTKASKGGFPYYDSATQSGGAITVSTSDPSGTPGAGDLWIKYTA